MSLRFLESDEPPLVDEGTADTAGDDTASNVGVRRDNSNHFTFGQRGSNSMRTFTCGQFERLNLHVFTPSTYFLRREVADNQTLVGPPVRTK